MKNYYLILKFDVHALPFSKDASGVSRPALVLDTV